MTGYATQTTDDAPCPKRLWVMTMLSDDEIVVPGDPLPQGLEFHLSRCTSCRALADELQSVAIGLCEVGGEDPPESLLRRAQRQAETALKDDARMTGRIEVGDADAELLERPNRAWWGQWTVPLAAAAMVAVAIGLFSIMRAPGAAEPGVTPTGVVQTGEERPAGAPRDAEQPQATLARDAIESDRDPTAIPEAYRSNHCKGENCVDKAFVPGRGRRRPTDRSLDTKGDKGSTAPVPNDR